MTRLWIVPAIVAASLLVCCDKEAPRAEPPPPVVTAAPAPPPAAPPPPAAATTETSPPGFITAQHLLVAYKGASAASPKITRTKEQAKKRAEEAADKAKSGTDFAELVAQYSDEPGAAERRGNLGKFTPDRMVKPFSDAAFALPVRVTDTESLHG